MNKLEQTPAEIMHGTIKDAILKYQDATGKKVQNIHIHDAFETGELIISATVRI